MSTLLAKIQIHPGKEADFEQLMAYMYSQTHETERDVLRYEYWRGRQAGMYYCLLSFTDNTAFWRHQASDHHEGQMQQFQVCIAELDLEIVDPVQRASPLPPTRAGEISAEEPDAIRQQAQQFPIEEPLWWESVSQSLG
jgi:quinol monooxygenase YgiN